MPTVPTSGCRRAQRADDGRDRVEHPLPRARRRRHPVLVEDRAVGVDDRPQHLGPTDVEPDTDACGHGPSARRTAARSVTSPSARSPRRRRRRVALGLPVCAPPSPRAARRATASVASTSTFTVSTTSCAAATRCSAASGCASPSASASASSAANPPARRRRRDRAASAPAARTGVVRVAPPHAGVVGRALRAVLEEGIAARRPGITHDGRGYCCFASTAFFSSRSAVPMIIPAARRLMMPGSGIERSTTRS